MTSDPTLTALRALKTLSENGSVSQTANELGLTQSAVSRSIAGLEKSVGLNLVRRGMRPLALSDEGLIVVAHAQDILLNLVSLEDRLSAVRQNKVGAVRIGSFGASASTRLLPPLMKGFNQRYSGISLNLHEAQDANTLENLQRDLVDMAVLADPGEDYDVIPLAQDRLVALVPENGPLVSMQSISPTALLPLPFIMTLGGSEPTITNWFGTTLSELVITQRIIQTHSILALVQSGLGNAIVAALSLPQDTPGVKRIPLQNAPETNIVLARKALEPRSKAAGLFWDYVESKTSQYLSFK